MPKASTTPLSEGSSDMEPRWLGHLLKYGGIGGGGFAAFLAIYIAVMQPMREDFIKGQEAQTRAQDSQAKQAEKQAAAFEALRMEFGKFRTDFTEWTRQVFVSRDLYDQRRAETDRRLAQMEERIKELERRPK